MALLSFFGPPAGEAVREAMDRFEGEGGAALVLTFLLIVSELVKGGAGVLLLSVESRLARPRSSEEPPLELLTTILTIGFLVVVGWPSTSSGISMTSITFPPDSSTPPSVNFFVARLFLDEKNVIHDFVGACTTTGFERVWGSSSALGGPGGVSNCGGSGGGGRSSRGIGALSRSASSFTNSASVFGVASSSLLPASGISFVPDEVGPEYAHAQIGAIHPPDAALSEVTERARSGPASVAGTTTSFSNSVFSRSADGGEGADGGGGLVALRTVVCPLNTFVLAVDETDLVGDRRPDSVSIGGAGSVAGV